MPNLAFHAARMQRVTLEQLRARARKVKLRLKKAGPQLGVTRQHLSLVLNGRRESRRLLDGFTALLIEAERQQRSTRKTAA
jgi:hypothetical protein